MARQQTTTQQQHLSIIRPRATQVLAGVIFLYLLLAGRLVLLQAVRHAYFQKEADAYRVSKNVLPARRGLILDRNGDLLATNVPAAAIYADPLEVPNPARTAARLAPLLGEDPDRLTVLLTPRTRRSHYVSLKRHAALALGDAVKRANLPGVGVFPDTRRAYPNDSLAANVLGFTDSDGGGVEGLEHSQERLLHGQDGKIVAEIDREGRFLPGTQRLRDEPRNGSDLVLTLDKDLQQDADTELAHAMQVHKGQAGVVIILDPHTGEILALSNAPSYNPNTPRAARRLNRTEALAQAARWRDVAVSNLYEPGSTLKTITASAVLQEQGLDKMNVHVFCSGAMQVGRRVIHCAQDPPYYGRHGDETLRGVLKESCNIGMAQFGMNLGAARLYKYEKKFGFLDYPGSGLPGEQRSWLLAPDRFNHFTGGVGWSKIQLANIAFGQGISITPLQLAAAYSAIANDGVLMQPHIVRAVCRGNARSDVPPHAVRRVLDPVIARTVRSLLGTVVQEGTGKPAQIAGFSVGGKTGSAQVAGAHGYEAGHYVASFVGLVPLSRPRLVILCSVFQPQGVQWGAAVAAPVVHNLARDAMLRLKVVPDAPRMVDWEDRHKLKKGKRAQLVSRVRL